MGVGGRGGGGMRLGEEGGNGFGEGSGMGKSKRFCEEGGLGFGEDGAVRSVVWDSVKVVKDSVRRVV